VLTFVTAAARPSCLQVRDFDVQDAVPYSVTLHYENKDGDPKTDVLFAQHR
jgi:hypothetical protein